MREGTLFEGGDEARGEVVGENKRDGVEACGAFAGGSGIELAVAFVGPGGAERGVAQGEKGDDHAADLVVVGLSVVAAFAAREAGLEGAEIFLEVGDAVDDAGEGALVAVEVGGEKFGREVVEGGRIGAAPFERVVVINPIRGAEQQRGASG